LTKAKALAGRGIRKERMKLKVLIPYIIFILIGAVGSHYCSMWFDSLMTHNRPASYSILNVIPYVASSDSASGLFLILLIVVLMAIGVLYLSTKTGYQSSLMVITPDISTPVPAGQGQCGTAKWLPKDKYDDSFAHCNINSNLELYGEIASVIIMDVIDEMERIRKVNQELFEMQRQLNIDPGMSEKVDDKRSELNDTRLVIRSVSAEHSLKALQDRIKNGEFDQQLLYSGGIVFGKQQIKSTMEKIFFNNLDTHTLILGATRSGKSRIIAMESIILLALAGESMIITDPKPELLYYTCKLLELLGYQVITQDYKNPKKSTRFNYLQPIIDCIDKEDLPGAIDATWDITSQLVGEPKGERLWNDGEASIIAASIMAVVYDNRDYENRKYVNLTNVFYFISQMCTPVSIGNASILPLNVYMRDLPYDHPSKALLSVGEIAPSRTRGSFYTSALMTLKLFTNPLIADMTSTTDYDGYKIGTKKTAIFIILPDDRNTYSSLASLFVTMQYQMLSKAADLRGGRLERRVNYILDEYGNFAKIANFTRMLTVGGGKGIRFNIFVQDFMQIEDVYDEKQAAIIRSNCENWIYLQTDDWNTLKTLSDKMGKYTINTYSVSANHQKFSNPSSSHNISLAGRELLTPDEIKKIKRPYSLVTSRNDPAIFYAPDLSKWHFNSLLGLGDEDHNLRLKLARDNLRPARTVTNKLELWGIWDEYIEIIQKEQKEKELRARQQMMEQLAQTNVYN
jgi:type IV secretion system protein VirD4